MSNWKERAEAELARLNTIKEAQRAEAEAIARQQKLVQEAEEQRKAAEEQQRIEIGRAKLVQFDALGISQKLVEINKDVLRGIGKVEIGNAIVTPKKAQQVVTLQFPIPNPNSVGEVKEDVWERAFGRIEVWGNGWASGGGEDRQGYNTSYRIGTRLGWFEKYVGKRIIGGYCSPIYKRSLDVAYYTNLESGDTKFGIDDGYYPLIIPPDVVIDKDWEIANASIEPEEEVPFNFRPYDVGLHDKKPKYGICVSFPYDKYDAGVLNTLIDPFLLKLSTAYLSNIDGWIKDKMEVDAKIREIQSRVGQIYPDRNKLRDR